MWLHWVICSFFASEYVSAVYGTIEYLYTVMVLLYQRANTFMLLCGALTSEYVCAVICYFCKRIWLRWFMEFFLKLLCLCGYMESFANAHVHAVLRFYGQCYLCFLRDLGLRDLFLSLFLSFLCMASSEWCGSPFS